MENLSEVQNYSYSGDKVFSGAQDFLPLLGTDYVELYVGNAKQAADWYVTRFGFTHFAFNGLVTGSRDVATHVVRQNKVRVLGRVAISRLFMEFD